MKKLPLLLALPVLFISCDRQLTLVSGDKTHYSIVISADATDLEKKSAEEFKRLIKLGTSVDFAIIRDTEPPKGKEIVIGNTNRNLPYPTEELQDDGFTIQTDRKSLFIAGGKDMGVLYGVYSFFDKYLGYRCYSPTVFKYPALDEIKIRPEMEDTQIPINTYRTIYSLLPYGNEFYRNWHKLDTDPTKEWGEWVHSFHRLVPAEKYFKYHPEYYAFVDGKRTAVQKDGHMPAQLCLSNEELADVVVESLKEKMAAKPGAEFWSVSPEDTYPDQPYNCTCPECTKIDSMAGSPAGSLIAFVNKVAAHFPDKYFPTLAYHYTLQAPKGVVPAENVHIILCTHGNHAQSFATDPSAEFFRKNMEAWGAITNNILIWDYLIQFPHLMAPFPNLRTIQPNIKYYTENGGTKHFQQEHRNTGGEFAELRTYLIARALWNPDMDSEAEMRDFLEGYFEEGAKYIAQYIELSHDELEASGKPLSNGGRPYDHFEGFLSIPLIEHYESFFDEAEKAVASKPGILERVKVTRLPLTYAKFDIARAIGVKDTRVFEKGADGKWTIREEALAELEHFRTLANKAGIDCLREWDYTPDQAYNDTLNALNKIAEDSSGQ